MIQRRIRRDDDHDRPIPHPPRPFALQVIHAELVMAHVAMCEEVLDDPEEAFGAGVQSQLFAHLADDCLRGCLTKLDTPTRQRPEIIVHASMQ